MGDGRDAHLVPQPVQQHADHIVLLRSGQRRAGRNMVPFGKAAAAAARGTELPLYADAAALFLKRPDDYRQFRQIEAV